MSDDGRTISEVLEQYWQARLKEMGVPEEDWPSPPPSISLQEFNRAMEPILRRADEMARELQEPADDGS